MIQLFYTAEFRRNLKKLAKRYKGLRNDLEPLLEALKTGETPGERLQLPGAILYKARVKNSDAVRGKSGGYRVIYYLKTEQSIILVTLYSKSDQSDISISQIKQIASQNQSFDE